ncbi:esterase/lipase family protein [Iodobacter fluviatilis]|uniref:Lipase n=1 Tax=Iodobacter fluviatilis TaxID=537 RepID=A0A7G3G5B2_9NEIS|nr:triacylglycerol lipase [Iodobacter fluviatilis]QBC42446.1 lipase [Iodobacter fluviatilis]
MKFFLKCFALFISLAAPAMAAGYTETRYPIVLVHGLFGFDQALGVDYFYKVPQSLQTDGAKVYVAQVSATHSSELRGEQLLAQVKQILAITGANKVNLIGHSHGGPTTRYVASVRPDLIASVTNIAGVNKGSVVADIVRKVAAPGTVNESVAMLIAQGLSTLIGLASQDGNLPQNPNAALDALTTVGTAKFNAKFPEGLPLAACNEGAYQVNGVRYYSWSGASPLTNAFDVSDAAMGLTSLAFKEKNDGLVSSCSSHLGQVLRDDYNMNHLDEINQFIGIVSLFETNPISVFRQHANRLKNAGL